MTKPITCDQRDGVVYDDLTRLAREGLLTSLTVTAITQMDGNSDVELAYVTAETSSEPKGPLYWVEPKGSAEPLLFENRAQLLRLLTVHFAGIPIMFIA